MKNRGGVVAAAFALAALLAGCGGLPVSGSGAYLKDIDPSKYVTLGEYTGLSVGVDAKETDDEGAEQYAAYYASLLEGAPVTDRAARLGDTANIDFAGRMADTGEYFEGGTGEGYDLVLGSGTFIPGFEDGVVGMTVGEEKDIPLTFPEDYGSEALAGKDVVFEVTLNSLTAPSDESVQALGLDGVSTVEEYIASLKEEYAVNLAEQFQTAAKEALRDKIESNATFKTPPTAFLERMQASYQEQLEILADAYTQAYGQTFTVSDLLGYAMSGQGYTGDEDSYIAASVTETANSYLTAAAIAKEQGITVSDEELEAAMAENLENSGYATLEEYMEASDLDEIREQVLYDKVMDFLVENNTVASEAE